MKRALIALPVVASLLSVATARNEDGLSVGKGTLPSTRDTNAFTGR